MNLSFSDLLHLVWQYPGPSILLLIAYCSFLWLSNIHCISALHLLCLFLCWWTFRLLPCSGYCEQSCKEHCCAYSLSRVRLFVNPWIVACQTPPSMGIVPVDNNRQEDWSGLSSPPPGDLPNPGIEHRSPALQADSLPSDPPGKPRWSKEHWVARIFINYEFLLVYIQGIAAF